MIKTLWFALKVAALVGLAVWLADNPGSVRLAWQDLQGNDFVINLHIGLFLVGILVFTLLSIFIYQTIKTFVDFPRSLARYNEVKAQEKGYVAITKGLSAVAAGDTGAALKYASKARQFMPQDTGLPLLLEAQAARLDGREGDAAQSFALMLEDQNASFLGVRGLLQAALDIGDDDTALELTQKALSTHPYQAWILKIAYKLQLKKHQWDDARKTLKVLEKRKVYTSERVRSDLAAMLVARARQASASGGDVESFVRDSLKKASKLYPEFVPAVLDLCALYVRGGKQKQAVKLIEKSWKIFPHALYVSAWQDLQAPEKAEEPLERLRWMERLLKINKTEAGACVAAGYAALGAGLWGEARHYFTQAEELEPSASVYRGLAALEEAFTHDEEAAKEWLLKAVNAPGEKSWVCRKTGRVFDEWEAFVPPEYMFNSLDWADPSQQDVVLLDNDAEDKTALLDAPESDAA